MAMLPLWFGGWAARGHTVDESVPGVVIIRSATGSVKWRSDCGYCTEHCNDKSDYFPRHDAGRNCQSGQHSHCTCDSCW